MPEPPAELPAQDLSAGRQHRADGEKNEKTVAIGVFLGVHHRGALPSPEDLERYGELFPGAAERVLAMTEAEQKHLRQLNLLRNIFAFVITFTAVAGGIFLIALEKTVAGGAILALLGCAALYLRIVGARADSGGKQ